MSLLERARDEVGEDGTPRRGIPRGVPLALLVVGVLWTAANTLVPVVETDTWWHLRLGDEFRDGMSLAHPQALSPFATEHWVPTQWLLEVAGSALAQHVGVAAVAWLVAAAACAIGLALFAAARLHAGPLAATVAALVALTSVSVFLVPRPQAATFVLLAVFVAAWSETARDLRPRWWLVPLAWVWACSHGMWFVGSAVGFAVILGLALDRRLSKPVALRLLAVPALGLVVAALTPVGPGLLLGPVRVSNVSSFIAEWQPPDFTEPYAAMAALMLFAVVVTWSRTSRSTPWVQVLQLALAGGCTLYAARTVPLGAILAAPLLAAALSSWLGERSPRTGARSDLRRAGLVVGAGLVLLTFLVRPHPAAVSPVGSGVDAELARLPQRSVVLNEYAFGGWLEWKHRALVPMIDGLTESYAAGYIARHGTTLRVQPGWRDLIEEADPSYALLYEGTPLTARLRAEGWATLARDRAGTGSEVVLLGRPLDRSNGGR